MHKIIPAICILSLFCACNNNRQEAKAPVHQEQTISRPDNFADDLKFLRQFASPAILKDSTSKSAIAIVHAWQGRVVTSTVADDGRSFGWLNYGAIENGRQNAFSTYGGEDRLLFGPAPDSSLAVPAHDSTDTPVHAPPPDPLQDSAALRLVSSAKGVTVLEGNLHLPNSKGNIVSADVSRTVTLLSRRDLHNYLGADIHRSIHAVGFHSDNVIINANTQRWDTAYGATAIRISGIFPVSPKAIAIVPLRPGASVPAAGSLSKEVFTIRNNIAYLRADGNSDIAFGVPQASALNFVGLYDPERKLLTIVQFTLPRSPQRYLGQTATDNEADVFRIRNNGPDNPEVRGRFVEVQSASPAAWLRPKGRMQHFHRTIHLEGSEKHLSDITKKLFGASLKEITAMLP